MLGAVVQEYIALLTVVRMYYREYCQTVCVVVGGGVNLTGISNFVFPFVGRFLSVVRLFDNYYV